MKLNYTIVELINKLKETGKSIYLHERPDKVEEFIVIDVISNTSKFADNRTHATYSTLQFTYFTTKRLNKMSLNKFFKETFNCQMTATYDADNNRFMTIYEVSLIIKEWDI